MTELNEELRAKMGEIISKGLDVGAPICDITPSIIQAIEPLIRQDERERIVKWLETYGGVMYLDEEMTDKRYCLTYDMWQTLKATVEK